MACCPAGAESINAVFTLGHSSLMHKAELKVLGMFDTLEDKGFHRRNGVVFKFYTSH